jgi:hypothetical protein
MEEAMTEAPQLRLIKGGKRDHVWEPKPGAFNVLTWQCACGVSKYGPGSEQSCKRSEAE